MAIVFIFAMIFWHVFSFDVAIDQELCQHSPILFCFEMLPLCWSNPHIMAHIWKNLMSHPQLPMSYTHVLFKGMLISRTHLYISHYLTFDFLLGPVDSHPIFNLLLHLFCPPSYTRKSENVPAETGDSLRWNAHRKHLALSFEKMVPPLRRRRFRNSGQLWTFQMLHDGSDGMFVVWEVPNLPKTDGHVLNLHDPSKWVLDEFSTCAPLKGCATKVMTSIPWLEEVAPPVALRYQSLTPLKGPASHISHAWWNVEMRSKNSWFWNVATPEW